MNQIRITSPSARPDYTLRLALICTKCGNEIRRGDCGTPHRPGSAQMMYKRILE